MMDSGYKTDDGCLRVEEHDHASEYIGVGPATTKTIRGQNIDSSIKRNNDFVVFEQ